MSDRSSTRATVLVVDDERGPRETLRMILQPSYRVLTVGTGSEALEALHTKPVDVVTLDLAMPGVGGEALMREIRSDFGDVEVIVITGHGSIESATAGIRCGLADYLQKPFDVAQVTSAVFRAMARRRGRQRLVRFLGELADAVGRDTDLAAVVALVEGDVRLRAHLGELLAKSAAEIRPLEALDPERALAFFEALAETIESQDPFMRGHARRAAFYAGLLADRLDLADAEKRVLRVAALVHDVGKIGVPSELLTRRGSLTLLERKAAERHAAVGARLLAPLGVSDELIAAVRHHHERWDGKGYPDGLAGEAIPLTARVLQLADAFDAMTCDRPYRRAFTQRVAAAELRRAAGSQFDPALVKAFLELVESGACELEAHHAAEALALDQHAEESVAPSTLPIQMRGHL
jgi:putative nucleotidyltransferase with HDIG domain